MKTIDINSDMGEGFGSYTIGSDMEMLSIASTANMACGLHAGDPLIMASLCAAAKARNVAVGAHPGYPDLVGFGRRHMDMSPTELEAYLVYQIGAADAMAKAAGHRLTHVKAHGAMGHLVADDEASAEIFIKAIRKLNPELILSAMAATPLWHVGMQSGLRVISEIYADRAYTDDFKLKSRKLPGAVIHDAEQSAKHVLAMVTEGCIIAESGKRLKVDIDTVCVHGDSPNAIGMAGAVRAALEGIGYKIAPYADIS
ncbi:LamB/YcsF family protein [Pandoraea sp. ISTKB]|uniref:LamB/YcsF family protein n=1 Tax=Pandoraea sp. ISTKB TaxID=1586708 RepID=UPI0008473FEE|nr:5-oxoprolinase subunit PxpA [Pandoraea sp. ISTKB]ODP31650.1 hypothetical protein A9762_06620 [Pandoraea sp. ISTKB]